jgi:transcription initiation factor TFIID subunit 5
LISDDPEAVTLTGSSQDAANQINQKEIHWGLLEDSLEERLEKPGTLLSDSEKGDGEAKEGENDESKVYLFKSVPPTLMYFHVYL